MSAGLPGIVVCSISLLVGWVGLWPIRQRLGAWGYHLFAFPVGLLVWCVVAAVAVALKRPFDAWSAGAGIAIFLAALWVLAKTVARADGQGKCVPPWSYFAMGGAFALCEILVAVGRFTVASADGWGAYWPYAVHMSRTGELWVKTMTDRGLAPVSMGAADILFGGRWAYVEYQMIAVSVLAAVWWLVGRDAIPRVGRSLGIAIGGGAAAILAVNATFVFNAFYVHSHAASALYLLLSLGALRMAVEPDTGRATPSAAAWLMVGGLGTAGFALSRPDGLVFSALPIAVAIALLTDAQWDGASARAYFTPMLTVLYVVFAAAFLRLGLWSGHKLTGPVALVALVLVSVSAIAPRLIRRVGQRYPLGGERLLPVALEAVSLVLVIAFVLKWDKLSETVMNARLNLFGGQGNWGDTWYWFVGLLVLSVFTADAFRSRTWTRSLFLTILLFVVLLFDVNMSRGGRPGWGDSLNRFAFHVVPVIVWYLGLVVARIVGDMVTRWRVGPREAS